ncbi:MAG: hypothetical protein M3O70_12655 [Actinomycetota bacterium]|nr:hypothetical protein [Actinomycetota bacterium]
MGGHLRPVVGDGQQDRARRVVGRQVDPRGRDQAPQALVGQSLVEQHLHLVEVSSVETRVAIQ